MLSKLSKNKKKVLHAQVLKRIRALKDVQRALKKNIKERPVISAIVHEIVQAGGSALLVGGAVRDLFLGLVPKDIDIEVYGVKIAQIQKILKKFGRLSLVGKSFGVLRINGLDVDWSLPRADSAGRKPLVQVDPLLDVCMAFSRRDLTINAMGLNLQTGELVDPFDGLRDLKLKILRTPDKKKFVEDPLRFFRVMQFVGRFGMKPDKELNSLCAKMDISGVSRERIEEEFKKLFLKAKNPSLGFNWLCSIDRLKDVLPEIYDTIGVVQDPVKHPEGDVYTHIMQVLDGVAGIKNISDHEKLLFCWAALAHDLGKKDTSKKWPDGGISAYGHAEFGVSLAKKLLKRITQDQKLIAGVCKIVKHHMKPGQFIANKAKPAAYKRLANELVPEVTLELLGEFARIDKLARNPKSHKLLRAGARYELLFARRARAYAVHKEPESPVLLGRDLLKYVQPGPELGKILARAYEIQLDEGIRDKKILKKRVLG